MTVNSLYIEYLQGVKRTRYFKVFADVSVYVSSTQIKNSQTSHKLLKGRLRDVITYKNRTTGFSSDQRSGLIYFIEDNVLHAISKL